MFSLEYTILFLVLIVLLLLLIYKKVESDINITSLTSLPSLISIENNHTQIEGMSSITQDTEDVLFYDELTKEDIDGDMFKVQYQISGLKGLTKNQIEDISYNVQKAVTTIQEIIPRSRKFFQELAAGDKRIPYTLKVKTKDNRSDVPLRRMVKDIYIKIVLADNVNSDTKVLVYRKKKINTNEGTNEPEYVFPTLSEIKLNKQKIVSNKDNYYILLHEMIRALGFGTLWTVPEYNANVRNYSRMWVKDISSNSPLYVGPNVKKYKGLSATAFYYNKYIMRQPSTFTIVPIVNSGTDPTKRWNFEMVSSKVNGEQSIPLTNEIMTEQVGTKISVVTIAALEDLGYIVNFQKSDVQTYKEKAIENEQVIQNVSTKDVSDVDINQNKPNSTISNINITGANKPDTSTQKELSLQNKPSLDAELNISTITPAGSPQAVSPPVIVSPPPPAVVSPSSPPSSPPSSLTSSKYTWYAVFLDRQFLIGSGVVCGVMVLFLLITIIFFNSKAN